MFCLVRKKSYVDETIHQNNERHAHFIRVLERVVEILRSCTSDKPKEEPRRKDGDVEKTTTMFSLLEVEMPSVEDEEGVIHAPSGPTEHGQKSTTEKENALYELDEPEDEVLPFVLYCLFEDVHQVGQIVRDIWEEYKAGKINIMTASVVTNTAIDLVRKTEDDIKAAHPQLSSYWPIAENMLELLAKEDTSLTDIPGFNRILKIIDTQCVQMCITTSFQDRVGRACRRLNVTKMTRPLFFKH